MIVPGRLAIIEIRQALADLDADFDTLDPDTIIHLRGIEVDSADIDADCEMCGGHGLPDPEPQVSERLISDFIAAINQGDLTTARALVGRVFEDGHDIRIVDQALCRCAS